MKPGFYTADQLSNKQYHLGPGISCSGLKLILDKTPYHYWAQYLSQQAQQSVPSHPKMIGTALHAAALEPDRFEAEYVVAPFGARNAAGYKAWEKEQDRLILLEKDMANVLGMRAALSTHPVARALLEDAFEFEYSAYAIDPETGMLCRARNDLLTHSGWIVDLKKCQDASPAGAAKSIANYGYYIQHPFYTDVMAWAGAEPAGFAFIFVEEQYPYAVGVYTVDPQDVMRGRLRYRTALRTYAQCHQSGDWPGYSDIAQVVELPAWARKKIDIRQEF